jgi:hypothetical protein
MMYIFDEHNNVSAQPESEEKRTMTTPELSVEYEYGENKFKASGNAQDVTMHAAAFLSSLGYTQPQARQNLMIGGEMGKLPLVAESDTPSLADDGVPQNNEQQTENQAAQVSDLLTFYLKKSPQGQYEQVAVITYWYQKCNGADSREVVTYDDYATAYSTLRRAAVTMPTNVKGSVRNTHNRTNHLFSPSPGNFAITIPGEQFVEQLGTQA